VNRYRNTSSSPKNPAGTQASYRIGPCTAIGPWSYVLYTGARLYGRGTDECQKTGPLSEFNYFPVQN